MSLYWLMASRSYACTLVCLVAAVVLSGCATGGAGYQSAVFGNTVVSGGTAYGAATSGNAAVGFRYGNPAPSGAPSASISVSSPEAAAVLVLGVTLMHALSGGSVPEAQRASPAPARVLHTCSCYGYVAPHPAAEPPPK